MIRRILCALFAVTISGTVAFAVPPAVTPTPTAKISSIERNISQPVNALEGWEAAIKARAARIEAELETLDRDALPEGHWARDFAGRYYAGDGLGTNAGILIAPQSGAAYLNYGCLGLYGGNHGDIVEVLPDGVRLDLELPTDRDISKFLDKRMYFVRWGDRRYLVPESEMMRLVNNYNEPEFGRRMMHGIPRLKVEGVHPRDWDEPLPPRRPELPAEYAKLLRDEPILLKVSAVAEGKRPHGILCKCPPETTIDFSTGLNDGVYVGLEFSYPPEIMGGSGVVEITHADEKSSRGRFRFYGDREKLTLPAVGEIVSNHRSRELPAASAAKPSSPK